MDKIAIKKTKRDGSETYFYYEYVATKNEALEWLRSQNVELDDFINEIENTNLHIVAGRFHMSYTKFRDVKALGVDTEEYRSTKIKQNAENVIQDNKDLNQRNMDRLINDIGINGIISFMNKALSKQEVAEFAIKYYLSYDTFISMLESLNIHIPHSSEYRKRKIDKEFADKYAEDISDMVERKIPIADMARRLSMDSSDESRLIRFMKQNYPDYKSDQRNSTLFENVCTASINRQERLDNEIFIAIDKYYNEIADAIQNLSTKEELINLIDKLSNIQISEYTLEKYISWRNIDISDSTTRDYY